MPSDSELRDAVHSIVLESDLLTMTARGVREQLASKFDSDMTEYKAKIKEFIQSALEERHRTEAAQQVSVVVDTSV